jgi:hypothetical protein
MHCNKQHLSVDHFVWACNVGEIVRPSTFAVFKFIAT